MTEYTCPMHPQIVAQGPGDCPLCGMALEPKIPTLEQEDTKESLQFWLSLLFTLPVVYIHMFAHDFPYGSWIQAICATIVVFFTGWSVTSKAISSFATWNLNMFSLIGLGVTAAYFFSFFQLFYNSNQLYFEAVAVIYTLVLLGQWLEARARKNTGEAISSLLRLVPDTAILLSADGSEKSVPLEQIQIGDRLLILPGSKIPIDGKVVEGNSWVNESMITGESEPVKKIPFESVIGGTLNGTGAFTMEVEKVGKDTMLARIIDLVVKARGSRAPVQKLADRVSEYFVPIVMVIALMTFIIWKWLGYPPEIGMEHAIAVLIIACPCALGLATPLSMTVGLGKGATNGILIKDSESIELMEKADRLVIDKTGTLTYGRPKVTMLKAILPHTEEEILSLGASLEKFSEHPIARAIVERASGLPLYKVSHFRALKGAGIQGEVEGDLIQIGNASLIPSSKEFQEWQAETDTIFYVAKNGHLIGAFAVTDSLKESAPEAIQQLQNKGMEIVMATGDRKKTAEKFANLLGIKYEAEVKPEDKLQLIKELQDQGHIVAMAGDGINDAPALAQADIGIAMGGGTDAAIENASIALLRGDLKGIVKTRNLSVATMKNVRQNLFLAFIYNLLALPLAAGALVPVGLNFTPIAASIAMTLSSLSVVFNALRLRFFKIND